MKRFFKNRYVRILFLVGFVFLVFVVACNIWIITSTENQIYSDVKKVPAKSAALLLGTNPLNRFGHPNQYFQKRIMAAVELYKAGKIKRIIVSGDNSRKTYNEPEAMKLALINAGVPENLIKLDYAGFRTFDSVIRFRNVFNETNIIIISQEFHNQRALFIANAEGYNAVAFNAAEVAVSYSFRTRFREFFAKTLAVLDVYVLETSPKFEN